MFRLSCDGGGGAKRLIDDALEAEVGSLGQFLLFQGSTSSKSDISRLSQRLRDGVVETSEIVRAAR